MFRGSSYEQVTKNGWTKIPEHFITVVKYSSSSKDRIVLTSLSGCLCAYRIEEWDKIERRILKQCHANDYWGPFKSLFLGNASICKINNEGYLKIPCHLKDYAKIKDKIVMVGVLDHFEIVNIRFWYEENKEYFDSSEVKYSSFEKFETSISELFEDEPINEDVLENLLNESPNHESKQEFEFSNEILNLKCFRGRYIKQVGHDEIIKLPDQFVNIAAYSKGWVVLTNIENTIYGYTLDHWKSDGKISSETLNEIDREQDNTFPINSAEYICKVQQNGQIQIPISLMKTAQIKNHTILLGCLDHFQIVDRQIYQRIIKKVEKDLETGTLNESIASLGL